MNIMNEYMNGLQSDLGNSVESPNAWSQMLMSMASTNNAWSAEQAQKQMDFQERMSNTAHQREIADLKAAGLNPILSAKLGGASTPSGASATADSSIVSAIVQLMDKMLDVQGTSAAAANNAVGAASGLSYGSGSGSSVLPFNYNPDHPVKDESGVPMTSSDVQGTLGIFGKYIPTAVADGIASLYNGINDLGNGKNKSTKTYELGNFIGSKIYSEENLAAGKAYHENRYAAANAILDSIGSVSKSSSKVKGVASIVKGANSAKQIAKG